MANKGSIGKHRFKARILGMMLLLLAAVFVITFLTFNFFIDHYIKTNIASQLNAFWEINGQYEAKPGKAPRSDLPNLAKQPKNKIGVRTQAFIVNREYDILNYYGNENSENPQELEQIASYLKKHQISLEGIDNLHLRTQGDDYYIATAKDPKQGGSFIIFYVNATIISNFAVTINLLLGAVMLIAAVLSFLMAALLANSVTRPAQELSSFARRIGGGDFTMENFSYPDKEFKELADVMNQMVRQLGNYDSEQKTFFQNVSHELRTPLMSIKCYAEGIECGLMERVKSSLIIIAEVDRLSEMVEDLLYISRIHNLTQHLEMQENDLRETLSLCAENLKSVALKNKIEIIYAFDDAPVVFPYHEKHMYRALYNLIDNALRYAKTKVILTCKAENGKIFVAVANDGRGIAPDILPHIFERFYKGQGGKNGIGLSIVKSIVRLHHGRISAACDGLTRFMIEFDLD